MRKKMILIFCSCLILMLSLSSMSGNKHSLLSGTNWKCISISDSLTGITRVFPEKNPLYAQCILESIEKSEGTHHVNGFKCYVGNMILFTKGGEDDLFGENIPHIYYHIPLLTPNTIEIAFHLLEEQPQKRYGRQIKKYDPQLYEILNTALNGYGSFTINGDELTINIIQTSKKPEKITWRFQKSNVHLGD
jgi:hypothetical protein